MKDYRDTEDIDWDLFRDAYALIKTTSDEDIDLEKWCQPHMVDPCRTLACAAGTLAVNPLFNDRGLKRHVRGKPYCIVNGEYLSGFEALACVFKISLVETTILFGIRGIAGERTAIKIADNDQPNHLSDRQVWLNRVEHFFARHGQIL